MKTVTDIKQLSRMRLEEAEILCAAGQYDGAFYLAGYSVELMLKAKICENFDMDDLFDEDSTIAGVSAVRKSVKEHDLNVLFIYSGLAKKFQRHKSTHPELMNNYALLMFKLPKKPNKQKTIQYEDKLWSEQARYLPIGSNNPQNVQMLIQLLKDSKGLLKWIENN